MILKLGWRNLWRQRRRNVMLLAAIFVAVAAVVLTNALIRGMQYDMRDSAVRNLTGNMKVYAPGYRDDPSILQGFELEQGWQPAVAPADLLGWTQRVSVPAVVMSERETRGVSLVGVSPEDERTQSFLGTVAIDGEPLRDADDGRMLLGAELAVQLGTQVGRRVVVITQGAREWFMLIEVTPENSVVLRQEKEHDRYLVDESETHDRPMTMGEVDTALADYVNSVKARATKK